MAIYKDDHIIFIDSLVVSSTRIVYNHMFEGIAWEYKFVPYFENFLNHISVGENKNIHNFFKRHKNEYIDTKTRKSIIKEFQKWNISLKIPKKSSPYIKFKKEIDYTLFVLKWS